MKLEDVEIGDNLIRDLRLSFSRVSEFDRSGPKSLVKRTKISGEFLDFGSLVDDMLQPGFNIDDNYYVFNGEKPTAMLGTLCDELINNINESGDNLPAGDYKTLVLTTIKNLGLWKTTKDDDKLVAKFTPNALAYVTAMVESVGKTLVTSMLVQEAEELADLLRMHEFSREFFNRDLIHQSAITFRYGNFNFLSLLDYIDVDHEAKTIRGIDLKTGSKPVSEFMSNFTKYRYYLQSNLYQVALVEYMRLNGIEDYEVLPFQFLYCGRYEKIPTFITVSEKWQVASTHGFTTKSGYTYRGLEELVESIEWHWRNEVFNMSKEQYENNGHIMINDEFINIG